MSSATPEALFDLLSSAPEWPGWFRPVRRVEWIGPVPGTVRRVTIGMVHVAEEILEEQRPVHHAYSIRSVIPVRDHRADVWFHPTARGTEIAWTTRLSPRVRGTGRPLIAGLRMGVTQLARALIRAAEREQDPSNSRDGAEI